jgi:cobyrinic acid a,c-diamide synthase
MTGDEPLVDDALRHHGDTEAGTGLLDFAVNVYAGDRSPWPATGSTACW